MPTYDYVCRNCEYEFEEFQSITANPLKKCPKCGKMQLKRLIGTGAGIIFKGSGFYETDYRSSEYKKKAKAESGSSSSDSSSSGDKSKSDSNKSNSADSSKSSSNSSSAKTTKSTKSD